MDWDLIEEVMLKTTAKVPSCPICLSPPVAAKITRCGHVYCWTCMLHYLSLSDDDHRKCPICFEDVKAPDLKSVVSIAWQEFKVGDELEFTLMRRERNSLFAMPVDEYFPEVNGKHPHMGQPNSHAQLVTAHPDQVSKLILSREQEELEGLRKELGDDPTVCYVEQALRELKERGLCLSLNAINMDEEEAAPEGSSESLRPRYESSSSEGSLEAVNDDGVTTKDLDFSVSHAVGGTRSKVKAPKETFYFYQCSDNQPIFLHALNVEMLVAEYGSFENCPPKIRGKILEKDSSSMTLDLRNKLRYLMHVPVTCAFDVAEIQLDNVSKDVLARFTPQLEARRLNRNKRAKQERKREKRIQVEENKWMGKYPGAKNLRIESAFHFPDIGANEVVPKRVSESSLASADSGVGESPFPPMPEGAGASFAKVKPVFSTKSYTRIF